MCQAVRMLASQTTVPTHYSMAAPYVAPSQPPAPRLNLTPLMMAVMSGNDLAVHELLHDPCVDVNEADAVRRCPSYRRWHAFVNLVWMEGNTAIFLACGARQETIVLQLLAHPGLDLDHSNHVLALVSHDYELELATVFHVACLHGLVDTVRYLASHAHVFINQGNCVGNTGFIIAAAHNHVQIVSYLLEHDSLDANQGDDVRCHA
ncbi:hypothetical protein AaE_011418 [Aphanomyces astaci]|uniref:Uncharacterized protein n=1 Tax=Aphanomyces astaci TaxID=112090 RepID=A0A6A4ZRY6_APHAT|nr:hypothetical protein AaE_011418 [Aphanomyces astaci]